MPLTQDFSITTLLMFWRQIILSSGRFPMHCRMYISTPGPCPPKPAVPPPPHHDKRRCLQTAASWEGKMDPGSDCSKPSANCSVQPPWTCRHEQAGAHGKRWGSRLKPGDRPPHPTPQEVMGKCWCELFWHLLWDLHPPPLLCVCSWLTQFCHFYCFPSSFFGSGLSHLPWFCPLRWRQRTAGSFRITMPPTPWRQSFSCSPAFPSSL